MAKKIKIINSMIKRVILLVLSLFLFKISFSIERLSKEQYINNTIINTSSGFQQYILIPVQYENEIKNILCTNIVFKIILKESRGYSTADFNRLLYLSLRLEESIILTKEEFQQLIEKSIKTECLNNISVDEIEKKFNFFLVDHVPIYDKMNDFACFLLEMIKLNYNICEIEENITVHIPSTVFNYNVNKILLKK